MAASQITIGDTVKFRLAFSGTLVTSLEASAIAEEVCLHVRGVSSVEREPDGVYWVHVRAYYVGIIPNVIADTESVVARYAQNHGIDCNIQGP